MKLRFGFAVAPCVPGSYAGRSGCAMARHTDVSNRHEPANRLVAFRIMPTVRFSTMDCRCAGQLRDL